MYISGTYPYLSRIFDHELSIIYPESIFPLFCNGFILFTLYCNPVTLFTFYYFVSFYAIIYELCSGI